MAFDLVQKGMIHVLYIFPRMLGSLSRPSKSRFVSLLAFVTICFDIILVLGN